MDVLWASTSERPRRRSVWVPVASRKLSCFVPLNAPARGPLPARSAGSEAEQPRLAPLRRAAGGETEGVGAFAGQAGGPISPPSSRGGRECVRLEGWGGPWASWFETRGFAALLTMRVQVIGPHQAQRIAAGALPRMLTPDFAALHPGYGPANRPRRRWP